jgi:hypothetical protein
MALDFIETTITKTNVHLRYADNTDPTKVVELMDFQFLLASLKQPNGGGTTLGDPELQYLLEIRAAVLLHARDAINAEIQRLRGQKGRAF